MKTMNHILSTIVIIAEPSYRDIWSAILTNAAFLPAIKR